MATELMRLTGALLLAAACAACGNSTPPSRDGTPDPSSDFTPSTETRYSLANGCFVLKSQATGTYAVRGDDGRYATTAPAAAGGEPLYLKPAALGRYFFYARDRSFIAAGSDVSSVTLPSDAVVFTIDKTTDGAFSIVSDATARALAVNGDGQLVLADASSSAAVATTFDFVPTSGCTPYPEMPVDVRGAPYKGRGIDQPVIGFADGHSHMMMASELSDGGGHVGPSAGGGLYGQPFNRFGVTEALGDCADFHGPEGARDMGFLIENGAPQPHGTQGWPTFIDWPVGANITHQGMYYRWVERAYRAGLRLLVNLGTNISALCEVASSTLGQAGADCNDMSLGIKQVKYAWQLQDYVDAQEGGPGRGWFRIVTSPAEARAVINDGKLAVVLGLEFANIFDCTVSFDPLGNETRGCDRAQIDRQMDEVYALGVRQIYLYHDVNTALGGTGLWDMGTGTLGLNLVGYWGTHAFWKTYDCPAVDYFAQDAVLPPNGGFYRGGAAQTTALPGTGSDPITQALFAATGGLLPIYPTGPQCNARSITDLGEYALERAMQKKFVLDVDHAELSIKQAMIDQAKRQIPSYPLVSLHGGHGGITLQMAKDILDLGGVIFPYNPNGTSAVTMLKELQSIWPAGRPLAMGYGYDGNGFGGMPGPRGAGHALIHYPFRLFEGPGWGPQFAAAGIQPVTVNRLTIPESGKSWDADVDGEPHYGMVADFVEQMRLEGGEEAVTALFNSAEAYLQMWEKVTNR